MKLPRFHLKKPLVWRAWYFDDAVYDSSTNRWRDIPDRHCLAVVVNGVQYTCTDCIGLMEDTGLVYQFALDMWTERVEDGLVDISMRMFPQTTRDDWKLGRETDMGNWRSLENEIAQYMESMK